MPTARMESHGILMAFVWFKLERWKYFKVGDRGSYYDRMQV